MATDFIKRNEALGRDSYREENLKEHFIRKWSTWFALEPNIKELREAFRKELDEIIG